MKGWPGAMAEVGWFPKLPPPGNAPQSQWKVMPAKKPKQNKKHSRAHRCPYSGKGKESPHSSVLPTIPGVEQYASCNCSQSHLSPAAAKCMALNSKALDSVGCVGAVLLLATRSLLWERWVSWSPHGCPSPRVRVGCSDHMLLWGCAVTCCFFPVQWLFVRGDRCLETVAGSAGSDWLCLCLPLRRTTLGAHCLADVVAGITVEFTEVAMPFGFHFPCGMSTGNGPVALFLCWQGTVSTSTNHRIVLMVNNPQKVKLSTVLAWKTC